IRDSTERGRPREARPGRSFSHGLRSGGSPTVCHHPPSWPAASARPPPDWPRASRAVTIDRSIIGSGTLPGCAAWRGEGGMPRTPHLPGRTRRTTGAVRHPETFGDVSPTIGPRLTNCQEELTDVHSVVVSGIGPSRRPSRRLRWRPRRQDPAAGGKLLPLSD